MTRSRKLLAGVAMVTAVAVTGVAVAAILFKLKGTGTSTGLNTTLNWTSANGTNDDGVGDDGMDPAAHGMGTIARAGYNVGSSTLALTANTLVLTIANSYENYRVTTHAVAATSAQDIRVQNVVVTGTDAALVTAKLDPAHCGLNLKTASVKEIDIGFTVGAVASGQNLSFGFDVIAVPASDYVAASCVGF